VQEIIKNLYVGGDQDVPRAKERGYSRLAACKDGPDGHRVMLGYKSLGAPQGNEYLFAQRGNWAALNLIDNDDPDMIPDAVLDAGLKFIHQQMLVGKKVLIHCNHGHSRGPTMALMYLRAIGELPQGFNRAVHIFRSLYPDYDVNSGMKSKAWERWKSLPKFFEK